MKNLIKISTVSLVALTLMLGSVSSAMAGGEYGPKNKQTGPMHQYKKERSPYLNCLEKLNKGLTTDCPQPVRPKPVDHKPFDPKKEWSHSPWKPSPMPPHRGTTWEEYRKCLELRKVAFFAPGKGGCKKPVTKDMNDYGHNGRHHGWDYAKKYDRHHNRDHHRNHDHDLGQAN